MSEQLMRFDPATGEERPYPSHAKQWREFKGDMAWLFDPWTGARRHASDVGSDLHGLLIVPDGEPLRAAPEPATVADDPIDPARFTQAPCYLCGYTGPDYYQPEVHRCAGDYHKAVAARVAVDAGALEALRSAMSKLRAPMSRTEYAVARAGIIEAAYCLLEGGE